MSSGSIQFRQSRNPHAGDHTARKLVTRKSFTPAPSSGLSAQPSSSQEEGGCAVSHVSLYKKSLHEVLCSNYWLDDPCERAEPQDIGHILKSFDLTSRFGPCLGLTRLERRVHPTLCVRGSAVLRAETTNPELITYARAPLQRFCTSMRGYCW